MKLFDIFDRISIGEHPLTLSKNIMKQSFLMLTIIALLCGCQATDGYVNPENTPSSSQSSSKDYTGFENVPSSSQGSRDYIGFGNTPCNLANGGYVCSNGSDVYVAKGIHTVYHYPADSFEQAELFLEDENGICNMNISGNTLYYTSNPNYFVKDLYAAKAYSSYIKAVDLSTGNTETLSVAEDGAYIANLYIVDEWAYYTVLYNAADYGTSYCKYFRLNLHNTNDVQELVGPEKIQAMFSASGIELSELGFDLNFDFTIAKGRIYCYGTDKGDNTYRYYLLSVLLNGEDLQILTDFQCKDFTVFLRMYANENSIFLEIQEGLTKYLNQWDLDQLHRETGAITTIPASQLHASEDIHLQDGLVTDSVSYYVSDENLYFFKIEDYNNQIFSVNQIQLKDMEHSIEKLSTQKDVQREWSKYGSFNSRVHMVGNTLFWGFPPTIYNTANQEYDSLFHDSNSSNDEPSQQQLPLLQNETLRWDGFRLSDTWDYTFLEDGVVHITSPVGNVPDTAFYELDNGQLTLFDENNEVLDVLNYDPSENVFRSTMRQIMVSQDYVDDNGVYHEIEYEYGTLYFLQSDVETTEASLDDIQNITDIVACYESCINDRFNVEVDYGQELPESWDGIGSFYRVVSPFTTTEQVKENIQKYLTDDLCSTFWNESSFRQVDGVLYLRKGSMGYISFDADKAILESVDEDGNYHVAIPEYGSADNYLETVIFIFERSTDGSFRLQNVL